MLVVSQTGSGKTLMFLLPLLQQLAGSSSSPAAPSATAALQPQGLVLLPTPDLAAQVATVAARLAAALPSPLTIQLLPSHNASPLPSPVTGPLIAVATPDTLTAHLAQNSVSTAMLTAVAIDEVDAVLCTRLVADAPAAMERATSLLDALRAGRACSAPPPRFLLVNSAFKMTNSALKMMISAFK